MLYVTIIRRVENLELCKMLLDKDKGNEKGTKEIDCVCLDRWSRSWPRRTA